MNKVGNQSWQDMLGDRFHYIKTLGGGGNGVVCRAYDKKISQEVAVKLLKRMSKEKEHRFVAEIRVVEQLAGSIDGIIPILESAPEEY